MCSNYQPINRNNNPWVKTHFGVDLPDADWKGHTWPMDKAPFIFVEAGEVKCTLGKFGIEPHWAQATPNFGRRTYNARIETITEKPSFKNAFRSCRFGLVLAEQFFEPYYESENSKPVWAGISRTDGEPTAIGAIWDKYTNGQTGEEVYSFSMLTLNADQHPFMRQFHEWGKEKRSVVIVENQNFNAWLEASNEIARILVELSPDGYLEKSI